jgi:hypothetical protein
MTAALTDMQKTAEEYGIPPDEFSQMYDHRIFRVLDALTKMKGRLSEVDKAGAAITKKVVKAQPKMPTGSRPAKNQGNRAKAAKSLDRMRKTGSIDDAVDYLLNQ